MSNEQLNQNNSSIDDLLDATLDDLADMPEFKPFTAGAYRMKLNWDATKRINDMPAVELKLTVIELVEIHNPEETPSAPGDTTNVLFILKKKDESGKIVANELAQGQMKAILAAIAPSFPEATSNRMIMEASENFEVVGVTSIRENKKDKNNIKRYTSLDNVVVV